MTNIRNEHKCKACHEIVHTLCIFVGNLEDPTCDLCHDKASKSENRTEINNQQEENQREGTPQEDVQQEITHQARRSPRTSIVTVSKHSSTNRRISAQKKSIAVVIPSEVPEVVQERNTINNCLISTITNSAIGDVRYIPKDYFYNKK